MVFTGKAHTIRSTGPSVGYSDSRSINLFSLQSEQFCDIYLDPGCHYANIIKLAAENQPIPTTEEIKIVDQLVPRPRGEEFAVEENDERTIRTTEIDAVNFEKAEKRLLQELKASLEKNAGSYV